MIFLINEDQYNNTYDMLLFENEILKEDKNYNTETLIEAVYQGKTVPLYKIIRGDVSKFKVYINSGKKDKDGKIIAKKLNFGHGGTSAKNKGEKTMRIKRQNLTNRKSFRSRFKCDSSEAKDRNNKRYWNCKTWDKEKISDLIKEELNNIDKNIIAYHGSKSKFNDFSLDYTGKGVDQEGPGFYFTSNYDDAEYYGDVNTYILDLNKLLSNNEPPIKKEIEYLIKNSPDMEDVLSNWGEDINRAYKLSVNTYMDKDSNAEALESIWFDFYLKNPDQYLKNLIKFGYDGKIIKINDKTTHYVVFNPDKITKIDEKLKENNINNLDEDTEYFGEKGAGVLVFAKNTKKFLVGLRSEGVNEPNTWNLFGGKFDGNKETSLMVSKRELKEETGYTGDIDMIKAFIFKDKNFVYTNYIGVIKEEYDPKLNWEHDEFKWLTYDELIKLPNKHFGLTQLLNNSKELIENIINS